MTDEKVVTGRVVKDLEIMDLHTHTVIILPDVYTQAHIPVAAKDIMTNDDLKKWPYVHRVELPSIVAEVGLLIGNNVPKAVEPLEVINSENGGPFACRSVLGWQVYGSTKNQEHNRVVSHRVKVKVRDDVEEKLEKLFNYDLNERLIDDQPEKSKEDLLFTKKVEILSESLMGIMRLLFH